MIIWDEPIEFEWDSGNIDKNLIRHGVANSEIEELFIDQNKMVGPDVKHSTAENRYFLIGTTRAGRLLYAILTIRRGNVRVISARDVSKKQRRFYEEAISTT